MLILWEYFKTKMKKIGPLERILHCVKIDKFKKMTLYIYSNTYNNIWNVDLPTLSVLATPLILGLRSLAELRK